MATKLLFKGLIIIFLFSLSSCIDWADDNIEGNDDVETEVRNIAGIVEVQSWGNFDVYINLADTTTLRVEAEENLLRYIITEVSGQKLTIEEKDGYDLENNRPMRIYISTPNLEEVTLGGSGSIECDSLSGDSFKAELLGSGKIEFNNLTVDDIEALIAGSGEIELEGDGKNSEFEIEGSGDIRAINFVHEDSECKIVGSGNIYVYATEFLRARITGSGTIYYEGNPDINELITGSGDIRRY